MCSHCSTTCMRRPIADDRIFGSVKKMFSQSGDGHSLVYSMHVPRGDEGQAISNINPDYPNADITVKDSSHAGEDTKKIIVDTHQKRLNIQSSVIQFQPTAEVDIKYLWPKDTALRSTNNKLYWSFELSEPISQEQYNEFASNTTNSRFGPSDFKLNNRGDAIYKRVGPSIGVRDTKRGLIRARSFNYDTILSNDTPSLPLRDGRNSDILTCVKP